MSTPQPDPRTTQDPALPTEIHRPGLGLMIKYWYGGRIPHRYSAWVLHDVTCRTWVLRHFARWTLLITAPFFVLYVLLVPGSTSLRMFTGLTFAGALLLFSLVNIIVDTDKRAVRAGYSYNEPARIRELRTTQAHTLAVAARRERMIDRRDQRRLPGPTDGA